MRSSSSVCFLVRPHHFPQDPASTRILSSPYYSQTSPIMDQVTRPSKSARPSQIAELGQIFEDPDRAIASLNRLPPDTEDFRGILSREEKLEYANICKELQQCAKVVCCFSPFPYPSSHFHKKNTENAYLTRGSSRMTCPMIMLSAHFQI